MEFTKKIKYIFRLIVTTPHYPLIFLLNLVSAVFTFAGIPLLFPALEYLRTDVAHERKLEYFQYVENIFEFIGFEANFFSIVIVASIFIFTGQLLLLLIELFNKHVQIILINNYMYKLISRYYQASWSCIGLSQHCTDIDRLSHAIHNEIIRNNQISSDERKRRIVCFLAAVIECGFQVSNKYQLFYVQPASDDEYKICGYELADGLIKYLTLHKNDGGYSFEI